MGHCSALYRTDLFCGVVSDHDVFGTDETEEDSLDTQSSLDSLVLRVEDDLYRAQVLQCSSSVLSCIALY